MHKYIDSDTVKETINGLPLLASIKDAWCSIVDDIPAADVRPVVRGKWLSTKEGHLTSKCSACGYKSLEDGNFCPNCGAKMREVDDVL